jgi:aspartate-semialdehyde dehydrogenase
MTRRRAPDGRIPVAVLGATGVVGQRLVAMLDGHPWLVAAELFASERSIGRPYVDAVTWRLPQDVPAEARGLVVQRLDPDAVRSPIALSALSAELAGPVEDALAEAGCAVVSNASAHRMDADVPLLVPEVNPHHARALETQRSRRRGGGLIVTNPNCSTVGVVMALAPIHRAFGLKRVFIVTLQALSGAGLPGVPALLVADSVIPHIDGEAAKIEAEPRRILGAFDEGAFVDAAFVVSARVHRVPVSDGHLAAISLETERPAPPAAAGEALRAFRGEPQELSLPSAPRAPLHVLDGPGRPQPALDRMREKGMSVSVGSIEPCPVLGLKLEALVHNTIRGAAGAALLNAEWLLARGLLDGIRGIRTREESRP